MRNATIAAVLLIALTLSVPRVTAQSGDDLFQKALATERADGDLRAAIQLYERVIKQFAGDRPLVARALVRIADCYEKLGQRDAMKVYERIVREFSDQAESVSLARSRLSALQLAPRARTAQTVRQAWAGAGVDKTGALSADGRYLSFTDWETGDLAIRDLSQGTSRRITSTGGWAESGDYAEYSVLSGDGRQVAYAWFTNKGAQPDAGRCVCTYDIRVASVAGDVNRPRVILKTQNGSEWLRPMAWTPDGKQLVVVRTLADQTHELALVGIEDGSVNAVKALGGAPETLSVSPDGKFVVYDKPAMSGTAASDIFVMAIGDARETPIAQTTAYERSPIWSADGNHVLFISDRTGTDALWRLAMRGDMPSGPPVLVMPAIGGNTGLLGSTRDGSLVYWAGGYAANIYVADVDENLQLQGTPTLAVERFVDSNEAVSWSPDGTRLAYLSRRGSDRRPYSTALMIHSMTTGEHREVPVRLDLVDRASWFPDGGSVLVAAREPSKQGLAFYRVDLATGSATLLMSTKQRGVPNRRPEISPDGRALIYVDRVPMSDAGIAIAELRRFELATRQDTAIKTLTGPDAGFTSFAVAPSGTDVAYLRVASGDSILELIREPGAAVQELSREKVTDSFARFAGVSWTADRRHILFVKTTGTQAAARSSIRKVSVAGGTPTDTGIAMSGVIRTVAIHPKGRRIAFAATDAAERTIWVVENFLPRATR